MHDIRKVDVMEGILDENDAIAQHIAEHMKDHKILVVNEMGAPGAGKTTTLKNIISHLDGIKPYVIEGDIESDLDTQDLNSLGIETYQINTFGACHLDAPMIDHMIDHMSFHQDHHHHEDHHQEGGCCHGHHGEGHHHGHGEGCGHHHHHQEGGCCHHHQEQAAGEGTGCCHHHQVQPSMLFIENVGNLVCPAEFSIGEHVKMLVSTVTEGSDKPYKYPLAFEKADIILLNKVDLIPYLDFDEEFFMKGIRALNKTVPVIRVSGKTGEGWQEVADWLTTKAKEL